MAVATVAIPEVVRGTPQDSKNGSDAMPPRQSGDRLTCAEFEHRYEAHPDTSE